MMFLGCFILMVMNLGFAAGNLYVGNYALTFFNAATSFTLYKVIQGY